MRLTLPERIQILRKRAGMNQAQLGSQAFQTSPESGRTKIKNIELGKQTPTPRDLKCIARCLSISHEQLIGTRQRGASNPTSGPGVFVSKKALDVFPELGDYLEMLDKAVEMEDEELVAYLSNRLAAILQASHNRSSAQTGGTSASGG